MVGGEIMRDGNQDLLALIGRVLLALMFVLEGVAKIGGFNDTVGYISSRGLPLPAVLAALAVAVEIGAGAALVVGYRTRWAALALALFTLLVSVLFHNFWAASVDEKMMQYLMFMKNIAVAGGMFMVAAFGAGRWSLDGHTGK
jgi:putative oxidoreductase